MKDLTFKPRIASHLVPFQFFSDNELFKIIYAMRKLDMLEYETLASGSPMVLRNFQNLLRYCGYNWWTTMPANVMAAAHRIKHEFEGEIPRNPEVLMTFMGVSRKVCMLILQDCWPNEETHKGLVCDRHVARVCHNLGWTDKKPNDNEAAIAWEVESWLPRKYFVPFNEGAAGLRQLWKDKSNHTKMLEAAEKRNMRDLLELVVKGQQSAVPKTKAVVDPLTIVVPK